MVESRMSYPQGHVIVVCQPVWPACSSLPNSGPSTRNVVALGQQQATAEVPEVELIDVNGAVAQSLYQAQVNQSFAQLGDGTSSIGGYQYR